jgi:hypothetical protein
MDWQKRERERVVSEREERERQQESVCKVMRK